MSSILKSIKSFILGTEQQTHAGNHGSDVNPVKKETASYPMAPRVLDSVAFRRIKTNYLAFNLEIAKPVPGDFNHWQDYRPLGISCAATICDGQYPRLWYSKNPDGSAALKLTEQDSFQLIAYLYQAVKKGWKIATWNGLGFDFQILAEESEEWDVGTELALGHIDMMFHLFCNKGYPIALNNAARGMKLPGKLEGMTGEMAPILWQQGQRTKVLQYVQQDACTTLDVAKAGLYYKKVCWTSNNGTPQTLDLPNGWRPVEEAMTLPKPDTSWIHNPIERTELYQWIFDYRSAMEEADWQMEQEAYYSDEDTDQSESRNTDSPLKEIEPSEDEINRQFAQYDQTWEPVQFQQHQPAKRIQSETSSIMGCPCPICQGAPNLDFRFKLDEEDNGYWHIYDDDY